MVTAEYKTDQLSDGWDTSRLDQKVVRLDYDWEVIYWCLVLQCTKQELEDAVRKVGNSAAEIKNLIRGN